MATKPRVIGTVNGKPVTYLNDQYLAVEFSSANGQWYLMPDGRRWDVHCVDWQAMGIANEVLAVHALAVAAGLPGFKPLPGEAAAKCAKRPGRDVCGGCQNRSSGGGPCVSRDWLPPCARAALTHVKRLEGLIATAAIPARNDKNGPWLNCTANCRAEAARIATVAAGSRRAKRARRGK